MSELRDQVEQLVTLAGPIHDPTPAVDALVDLVAAVRAERARYRNALEQIAAAHREFHECSPLTGMIAADLYQSGDPGQFTECPTAEIARRALETP